MARPRTTPSSPGWHHDDGGDDTPARRPRTVVRQASPGQPWLRPATGPGVGARPADDRVYVPRGLLLVLLMAAAVAAGWLSHLATAQPVRTPAAVPVVAGSAAPGPTPDDRSAPGTTNIYLTIVNGVAASPTTQRVLPPSP